MSGKNSGESRARDHQNQTKCLFKQLMFKNSIEKQWKSILKGKYSYFDYYKNGVRVKCIPDIIVVWL